jgi:hypothetical protein
MGDLSVNPYRALRTPALAGGAREDPRRAEDAIFPKIVSFIRFLVEPAWETYWSRILGLLISKSQ